MPSESGAQHRQFEVWKHDPSERPPSLSARQVDEWTEADRGNPLARGTGHVRRPHHHAGGGGILEHQLGGHYSRALADGGSADPSSLYALLGQLAGYSGHDANWGRGTLDAPPSTPTTDEKPVARDAGGILPSPVASQSPMLRNYYQQLMKMPPEKLQELAARVPSNSPQGAIIRQAVQLQHMQPTQAPPTQAAAPTPSLQAEQAAEGQQQQGEQQPGILAETAPQPQARGGEVQRLQFGGEPLGVSMGMADPWWTRRAGYEMDSNSAYLHGPTAGRADNITTTAPGGSYVVPADVIAGLGEGNGLFGARVWDEMMHSYMGGMKPPPRGRGSRLPRPPEPQREQQQRAGGGNVQGIGRPVPVKLSHGELVIGPARVLAIGREILRRNGGTGASPKVAMKLGHDALDEIVKEARKRHIEKLRSLPGPTR